jgi:hypothetical protein
VRFSGVVIKSHQDSPVGSSASGILADGMETRGSHKRIRETPAERGTSDVDTDSRSLRRRGETESTAGRAKRRKRGPSKCCHEAPTDDGAKDGDPKSDVVRAEAEDEHSPLAALPNEMLLHILRFMELKPTLFLAEASRSLRARVRCLARWKRLVMRHATQRHRNVFHWMIQLTRHWSANPLAGVDRMGMVLTCASMCRPEACKTRGQEVSAFVSRGRAKESPPFSTARHSETLAPLFAISCIENGVHVSPDRWNSARTPRQYGVLFAGNEPGEGNVRWWGCRTGGTDEADLVLVFRLHAEMSVPACKLLSRNIHYGDTMERFASQRDDVNRMLLVFYRAPLVVGATMKQPPHLVRARMMKKTADAFGVASWEFDRDLSNVVLANFDRTEGGRMCGSIRLPLSSLRPPAGNEQTQRAGACEPIVISDD